MLKKTYVLVLVLFSLVSFSLNAQENRTIDGSNNNLSNPEWGAANAEMPRLTQPNFADNISTINDSNLPNPRYISNSVFSQTDIIANQMVLSDYVWAFGQFIKHDLSLVEKGSERVFIQLPENEEIFSSAIPVSRSKAIAGTGINTPRQYANSISSFIDGSMIYGSDLQRANWLRTNDGTGKLKTSQNGKFLPLNTLSGEYNSSEIDFNAPAMEDPLGQNVLTFVAGDPRANENPLLTSLHTLFVMEHNRMCDELRLRNPSWSGTQIYERARKYVGAYLQSIVYNEWLPSMGIDLPAYNDYKDFIDPSISNLFSAAAFKIRYTLTNSEILRMDNDGEIIEGGNMTLAETYYNPEELIVSNSIEPFLKGMATHMQQEMDCKVVDDLRNFELEPGFGFDLVSSNIFRGRERGLPDYNTIREQIGLAKVQSFIEITGNENSAALMESIYGTIHQIDPWVGFLAERHMNGKLFGRTLNKILSDQFQALREGDRFYFEVDPAFTATDIAQINNTKLSDIIMRNTSIDLMQQNVFIAMDHDDIPTGGPNLIGLQLESAVYPNPVNQNSVLKVYAEYESDVRISIFNSQGLIVYDRNVQMNLGENIIPLNITRDIIRGVYTMSLVSDDRSNVIKLVVE